MSTRNETQNKKIILRIERLLGKADLMDNDLREALFSRIIAEYSPPPKRDTKVVA